MTPERLDAIEQLFHQTRARAPDERAAFLAAACAGDSDLRREVESLLAEGPGGVIDAPVAVLAAALVAPSSPRLAPGASLGPYRIDCLLGAGGMGEVYRARDTTLGRDVAIKVLPRDFTGDANRLSRFEREARLLAALNHPHIAAIYGVAEGDGVRGLVLELVEGPTLAKRLTAGPLAIAEALSIAHQVAGALEAAHETGVLHRDLKPANIKVTPEGAVKVIDFGLGKMVASEVTARDDTETELSAATESGAIIGTATYMSPEQARGRPADARADIWAFGCVLFEMLTGANPFHADTAPDAIARILEREPDWNALPTGLPAAIRRLVRRCLTKNPADRLHAIADARLELADALSSSASPERDSLHSPFAYRPWVAAAAVAMTIAAAVLLIRAPAIGPQTTTGILEFRINVNDSGGLGVAVSPNGRHVAFSTFAVGGPQIWLHALDSDVTRSMPGGAGGVMPFWSPDGASLGLFAMDGMIKRIAVASGSTTVICPANAPAGATWNADGVILFSAGSSLFRVPSAGGTAAPIEIADSDVGESAIRTYPQFLADGRHFIYHASGSRGVGVRVGSLDSAETRHLVESDYPAVYAASHLLFLRGAVLMAQAFNQKTFTLDGAASAVAADAAPGYLLGPPGRLVQFSASGNVLALMKARGGVAAQLTWFDRAGTRSSAIAQVPNVEYLNPAISPDGTRLAANRMDPVTGNWDIWIVDLVRDISSRLTFDPGQDADPVWSADSKEIVFASNRGGRYGLYRKAVDGSGSEELLATIDGRVTGMSVDDWSPDGRFVLYDVGTEPISGWAIWALPLFGDRRPFPVFQDSFARHGGRFSPDGRWIAYSSTETGGYEVHVQRFNAPGDKKQISRGGGGSHPRWVSGGREIVYWIAEAGLASVDVDLSGPSLRVGAPKMLMSAAIATLIDGRTHYDVTRDGRRFLLRHPSGPERPAITVMVNWEEKLNK